MWYDVNHSKCTRNVYFLMLTTAHNCMFLRYLVGLTRKRAIQRFLHIFKAFQYQVAYHISWFLWICILNGTTELLRAILLVH